jgi:hypothetical protein
MKAAWRLLTGLVLIGFFYSSIFGGDTGNIKINPQITIQEEYNDNINLTSRAAKSDWISTIYPGIKFSGSDNTYGLNLDYKMGLLFFASGTDNNAVSHLGKVNGYYRFNPRWAFRIKEDFLRSTDTREVDPLLSAVENQSYYSSNQSRNPFLRNVLEPSLEYQFGKEDLVTLTYRNNIFQTQNPLSQNSQENLVKVGITYWLDIRNGILGEYSFSKGTFERSADLQSQLTRFRYTHRFNPATSLFGEYSFQRNDSTTSGMNYTTHNPSFGVNHAFNQTLSGTAQVGYYWKNSDLGSNNNFSYQANLTQKEQKTTYTFSFQGGFTQDLFSSQNLGFTRFNRGLGRISHRILERLTLSITGMIERAEFDNNRTDWISGVTGSTSYQILEWLTLSVEASHRENNSTVDINSYIENRAIFKMTAMY